MLFLIVIEGYTVIKLFLDLHSKSQMPVNDLMEASEREREKKKCIKNCVKNVKCFIFLKCMYKISQQFIILISDKLIGKFTKKSN